MACNCQPCTLDKEAVLAAVRQMFAAKLRQAFDGKRIACGGSDGWWTGLWDPYAAKWSGHRHVLHGEYTLLACDGQTITATICYSVEDLGTWADVYPQS